LRESTDGMLSKLVLLLAVCGARGFLLPVAHRAAVSTTASQYAVAARLPAVQMGRGDKRTKKGKRTAQTFGNARPKNGKLRRERDGPMENVAAVKAAAAAAAKAEEEAAAAAASVKAEAEAAAAAAAAKAEEEAAAAAAAAKAEEEAAAAAAAAKAEEAAAAAKAAKAEEEAAAAAKAEEEAAAAEAEEAAAPVLSASDLMALMKQLRAELPRADLKACKAALESTGGDLAAASAALTAEHGEAWAAAEAADAAEIQAGTVKAMGMRDAKAQKKFAAEEAASVEAAAEAPEPEPAVAEEVAVAEEEEAEEAVAPAVASAEEEMVGVVASTTDFVWPAATGGVWDKAIV